MQEFDLALNSLLMIARAMEVAEQQGTSVEGKISNVVKTLDSKDGELNHNNFKNSHLRTSCIEIIYIPLLRNLPPI